MEIADVSLYADDTAVMVSCDSYIDIILSLRIELETLKQWLYLNKLMLNVKFLVCGSKTKLKQIQEIPLVLNNEVIEHIYRKACGKLGALRKTRNCLDKKKRIASLQIINTTTIRLL